MKNTAEQTLLVQLKDLESITSFVSENTTIKGDIVADEGVNIGMKIDGKLLGSIRVPAGGVVHIGPTGNVACEMIEADYVYVEGIVHGTIVARKGVELGASCTVSGAVKYHGACSIHSMAKVRAKIEYSGEGWAETALAA